MDLFEFDLNLVPKVGAQSTDGDIQPTFGSITGVDTPGTTASITLTADNTTVAIGNNVNVDVEIKTGTFAIGEYRIIVDFDPTKLAVVDADPATPGTQIAYFDVVFSVSTGDNITSAAGRVTLIAKAPTSSALTVNRKVARITFQAQAQGSTTVRTVTGATGSQLINQNGVAIATNVNSVTLNLSNQAATSSLPTTITTTQVSTPASTSMATSTGGGSDNEPIIPDTALPDDIVAIFSALLGISLLGLGVLLRRSRKRYDE